MAYSLDLRQRVIDAIGGGLSTRAAARWFAIGESTAAGLAPALTRRTLRHNAEGVAGCHVRINGLECVRPLAMGMSMAPA